MPIVRVLIRAVRLGAIALLALAATSGWLFSQFGDSTPVTVGEGSIYIETHPNCPFAFGGGQCWQKISDNVIETRVKKAWKKVKAGSKDEANADRDDCTGRDSCALKATFSDGSTVEITQATKGRGMRITSSRKFSTYTLSANKLVMEYGAENLTLRSAVLTKTHQNQTQSLDVCAGVSRCRATIDHAR